jgi:predicted RNase H-like HicB family nuclease
MKKKVSFTYWIEADNSYLGYLNDYPDHWTQGKDLTDLKEHLLDLYNLFTQDKIVGIKKVDELLIT